MAGDELAGEVALRQPDHQATHLAERFQLSLMIALGKAILVTGVTFGQLPWSPARLTALVVAFVGRAGAVVDLLQPQRPGRPTRTGWADGVYRAGSPVEGILNLK